MANPQKENGHTGINHEDMMALIKSDLCAGEYKIILYILRMTWGCNRREVVLKTSTIVTETKLSKKSVCENINKLVTKRLLFKSNNRYEFNKNYDDWKVTERLLGSYRKVTMKLPKGNQNMVSEIKIRNKDCKERADNNNNFNKFWNEYPRKISKKKALDSWRKINPSIELEEKILNSLEKHKTTRQWLKDNGEFIPHPATWLNQCRWEDEIETKSAIKNIGNLEGVNYEKV